MDARWHPFLVVVVDEFHNRLIRQFERPAVDRSAMRPHVHHAAVCAVTIALVVAGCSGEAPGVERGEPSESEVSASASVPPYLAVPEPPGDLFDVGGHRMHLYCTGEGDPTVVLDAGSGGWSLHLRPLQVELAGTTRVCTYDRAGYGWSEPGPEPRTGKRIVGELEALLEEAGEPGPYVLAGHSFGGVTMLMFAELNLKNVAGVVLIDASHPHQDEELALVPDLEAAQQADLAETKAIAARLDAGLVDAADVLPLAPKYLPLDLKYQWAALIARPRSLQALLAEDAAWAETTAQVGGRGSLGDVPLIVIAAGRGIADADAGVGVGLSPQDAKRVDSIWRGLQEDHLTRSTNARLVVAQNSDHDIYASEPELVIDAIGDLTATG
jgi:pimeloyl-ACP methyl ester carboxylesterase